MFINLSGYEIYAKSKEELINNIELHINDNSKSKLNIISGNPEVLFNGLNSLELNDFFKRKDSLIIPDGVGVVMLSKILRRPVKEKVAGIDIMEAILNILDKNSLSIYFLGASDENLKSAVNNISNKYKNIVIEGYYHGYFDSKKEEEIVVEIKNKKPSVIFVALGSPKQEKFISKYMDELSCKVFMGVGGCFDLYSGKIKRAPKLMIKLGIEWVYRVYKEPIRLKRLVSIPKFILKSIVYDFKGGN